jgi:hypothetical protein
VRRCHAISFDERPSNSPGLSHDREFRAQTRSFRRRKKPAYRLSRSPRPSTGSSSSRRRRTGPTRSRNGRSNGRNIPRLRPRPGRKRDAGAQRNSWNERVARPGVYPAVALSVATLRGNASRRAEDSPEPIDLARIPDTKLQIHSPVVRAYRANPGPPVVLNTRGACRRFRKVGV